MMVPVIPGTYSALLGTSTATSSAMLLPRGILNSQSRGVLHEIISATTAAQLEQLGDCHEGPTTRSNTVKSGRRSIDREGAREDQERQGRHREVRRGTGFLEQNQQVQK